MAVDPFGRRIHDDIRTPLERVAEVARSAERVVHHKGYVVLIGQCAQRFQVGHGTGRIAHALGVERPGAVVDQPLEIFRPFALSDPAVDAQLAQRRAELVVGAAVQVGRSDDVVALGGQREHGDEDGRHARRDGQRAHGSVERGDTLLVGGGSGILQAGVDVPGLAQVEEPGRMVACLETVGGRRTDRHAAGSGLGIGLKTRMDLQGLESVVFRIHIFVMSVRTIFTKKSDLREAGLYLSACKDLTPG